MIQPTDKSSSISGKLKATSAVAVAGIFFIGITTFAGVNTRRQNPETTFSYSTYEIREDNNPLKYLHMAIEFLAKEPTGHFQKAGLFLNDFLDIKFHQGYSTINDYFGAMNASFEINNINPNDPNDHYKKFTLLSEMGFAVRETNDRRFNIYVPFDSWVTKVNENSDFDTGSWEKLKIHNPAPEKTLLGQSLGIADSSGNGTVNDKEWINALRDMGYKTKEERIQERIYWFEIAQTVARDLSEPGIKITVYTDTTNIESQLVPGFIPPPSKLEAYVAAHRN